MIIFNFFRYLIEYIRFVIILNPVYRKERIIEGLSELFNSPVKKDWVGRLYAVINPFINKDGEFDQSMVITELGSDMPSPMIVEKFIMDRLNIAQRYIQASNLFDLLTYKIEKIDGYYNYLLIIEPLPFNDFKTWTKRFLWLLVVLIFVAIGVLIFI